MPLPINNHHRFKHGKDSNVAVAKRKELTSVLRSFEDILFLVGAIEGQQHTRGNLPAGYQKIQTIEQAQNYILALENIKTSD
jgi:hypothetical protein